MDLSGFNAANIEPQSTPDPLPAGDYIVVITESEEKRTKKGDGSYLELTVQVVDGQHTGRLLWARLNLQNANPVAVKIAQEELSAICRAVGVMTPRHSNELHGKPLLAKVKLRTTDTGNLANEIKGWAPARVAPAPQQQVPNKSMVAPGANGMAWGGAPQQMNGPAWGVRPN